MGEEKERRQKAESSCWLTPVLPRLGATMGAVNERRHARLSPSSSIVSRGSSLPILGDILCRVQFGEPSQHEICLEAPVIYFPSLAPSRNLHHQGLCCSSIRTLLVRLPNKSKPMHARQTMRQSTHSPLLFPNVEI
ncbi:hypothetical protein HYQ46_008172 [Verticillium longisporum]|nr:hypothetical protein HYQ46_008172 [Verticillium longisporum]